MTDRQAFSRVVAGVFLILLIAALGTSQAMAQGLPLPLGDSEDDSGDTGDGDGGAGSGGDGGGSSDGEGDSGSDDAGGGGNPLAGLTGGAGSGGEVRLEHELGGYRISASGSPFEILMFEPVAPVPVDPGQPHLSLETAHTLAELNTGPQARALASSAWPGSLLGDGFGTVGGQVTGDDSQPYPVAADARYPGQQEVAMEVPEVGIGMLAQARGLDVRALSRTGSTPPEVGLVGTYESDSQSTVEGDQAIARSRVAMSDISLGGLIEIDSVVTDISATATPDERGTSGATTVNGLTIMGTGYAIDGNGLQPVQEGSGGEGLVPPPSSLLPLDEVPLREQVGISVELLDHTEEVDDIIASRTAGGVKISIDTRVLRSYIEDPVLNPLITSLPPEFVELPIYSFLFLAPKVDFIIGAAEVSSSATEPLTFPTPELPQAGTSGGEQATTGSTGGGGSSSSSVSSGSSGSRPSSSGGSTSQASSPGAVGQTEASPAEPTSAPPVQQAATPVAATLPTPEAGGIGLGLLMASLLGTAGASRGLRAMAGPALGLTGGSICDEGRAKGVPNLKADG